MSSSRQPLLVAAIVATVLIALPLMASTASRPAVIFVDDDNCPGPGSGTKLALAGWPVLAIIRARPRLSATNRYSLPPFESPRVAAWLARPGHVER